MLVTSLGQYPVILSKPWMQKHGVILDMSCNKCTFWPDYCQHSKAKKLKDELPPPLVKRLAPTLKINKLIRKDQLANNTLRYVISANKKTALKAILKPALKSAILKVILKMSLRAKKPRVKKLTKPLKLAMVGAVSF